MDLEFTTPLFFSDTNILPFSESNLLEINVTPHRIIMKNNNTLQ